MTIRVTNSMEKALRFIRALLYGESGIGKTTSLRELPEAATLIVVTERGLMPLRHWKFRVAMVDSWEDIRNLHRAFTTAEVEADGSMTITIDDVTISGIRVIAFDSLTELARLCVRHMMEIDRPALVKARTADKKGKEKKENVDKLYEEQMQPEDWSVLGDRLGGYLAATVKLPCHIVFTSLAKWHTSKVPENTLCVPDIKGGTARSCPQYFDQVLHMESDPDGNRIWRTFNDNMHVCKDSSAMLDKIEPASWNNLFTKILKPVTATKTKTETETTEGEST